MISVITTSELGKLLHAYGDFQNFPVKSRTAYKALVAWLKTHSGKLTPTFPETSDQNIQTYFSLTTKSDLKQEGLKTFLKLPGIEGAYEKPMDDLPG